MKGGVSGALGRLVHAQPGGFVLPRALLKEGGTMLSQRERCRRRVLGRWMFEAAERWADAGGAGPLHPWLHRTKGGYKCYVRRQP